MKPGARRPGKGKLYGPATADRQRTTHARSSAHARDRACPPRPHRGVSRGPALTQDTPREEKASSYGLTLRHPQLPVIVVVATVRGRPDRHEKQEEEINFEPSF